MTRAGEVLALDAVERYPHAVIVCDPSGRVMTLNRRARELMATGQEPTLRIFALGRLRVAGPEGPLAQDWLGQRPGQLLRFLVCQRHRIAPADVIAEAMWPYPGAGAPITVRCLVHALRARLEPGRAGNALSPVVCHRGGYALDHDQVWIDVDEFEREATSGLAALATGDRARARECLERAVDLYEDDLLTDEPYADWVLVERERLRALAADALRALAELCAEEPHAAAGYLERLSELEPFDDDVERQLLSAWLRMGRKSRAARHYHWFRVRVQREFGAGPELELAPLMRAG
jgi:DNA-binding SARP family transcriptional activator